MILYSTILRDTTYRHIVAILLQYSENTQNNAMHDDIACHFECCIICHILIFFSFLWALDYRNHQSESVD